MATKTLNVKVHFTSFTTAEWETNKTKVLPKGFLGIEFTEDDKTLLKVGDGVKTWEALPYTGAAIDEDSVTAALTNVVGAANGIAGLDESGKVPAEQLPSYVDDVIEGYFDTGSGKFYKEESKTTEITGETGKIYVNITDGKCYRWGGTIFVEISSNVEITIDDTLSETSTNAIQNKAVNAALATKIDTTDDLVLNCTL